MSSNHVLIEHRTPPARRGGAAWRFARGAACLVAILAGSAAGCGGGRQDNGQLTLNEQYQVALRFTDPQVRGLRLLEVARRQRQAGDVFGAQTSLRDAAKAANAIASPETKARLYVELADQWCELNDRQLARNLLTEVLASAGKSGDIPRPFQRIRLTLNVLEVAHRHRISLGPASIDEILADLDDLVVSIDDPRFIVEAAADVGVTYFRLGNVEEARRRIDTLWQETRTDDEPRELAELLTILAVRLERTERREDAETAFGEAQAAIQRIEDPVSRGYAWVELAVGQRQTGRAAAAGHALQQAEQVAATITDPGMRESLLQKIANERNLPTPGP